MSGQMMFFRKSACDFERPSVVLTASNNQSSVRNIIDRSNRTAYGTVDTVGAETIEINFGDVQTIDHIMLLGHNMKTFSIQQWDDVNEIWTALSPAINVTVTDQPNHIYEITPTQTSKLLLSFNGAQVLFDEVYLTQFIATEKIGRLNGWPVIKKPVLSRNLNERKSLSGKAFIQQNVGFYSASLTVENWSDSQDLALVEELFSASEGFLFWPCGGVESQFSSVRRGYRVGDIYLMRCRNEFSPEWFRGFYKSGMKIQMDLVEVLT